MIWTVTFSPSLDYALEVDGLEPGVHIARRADLRPGGKGVNVALVAKALGAEAAALGFTAGFTGREIVRALKEAGLRTDFLPAKGRCRINVKLLAGQETQVNAPGVEIGPAQVEKLTRKLSAAGKGDFAVLAGAVPPKLGDGVYAEILKAGRGAEFAVDARKGLLQKTLPHHPFLVKPNDEELSELLGRPLSGEAELWEGAEQVQRKGARNVAVSLGGRGAMLLTEGGERWFAAPPAGRVVNTVGAGDSLVAGFLVGWQRTKDFAEALRLGVAAGSATAFREGLCGPGEAEALLPEVRIERR